MVLSEYLTSQFSLAQNIDFFVRILVACLCGACIGVERSKRFKEAGIRTHLIVCLAASLLMILSKYGFVDLTSPEGVVYNGTRGADSARIAAQVVSGISFLGAGVIFKHGSSVKGLTTAAGLWATAGIGLAIGAGMYSIGIFTTITIIVIQIVMHKFVLGTDSLICSHLQFTIANSKDLQNAIHGFIHEKKMQMVESGVTYHDDGYVSYDMIVKSPCEISLYELECFLCTCGAVRDIRYTAVL